MPPSSWQRVRELFESATELPPEDRNTFLEAQCEGDEALRHEVEEMLRADTDAESVDKLDAGARAWLSGAAQETMVGLRIGQYVITGHLGSGGMGAVYLAEQEDPRRSVALKMMNHGLFSEEARRRFRYEADVLASLHHPGIAQIYEVGTWDTDGHAVPFYAMEHIRDAERLNAWAASRDRSAVIRQFVRICDAVHHAHLRGVIHRDLKPSNILVDSEGFAKVIDFGIARTTDAVDSRTLAGSILGTPPYMAYEQMDPRASGPGGVDLRVDVHALGVILFELLTGRPPFRFAETPLSEVARRMSVEEMPRPSTLATLPPELDWIVLKAGSRERERRYASTADLAEDLRRFLRNEPVLAAPPRASYRLRKFVARNRILVGAAFIVFVALVCGTTLAYAGLLDARESEQLANTAKRRAEQELETQEAVTDWLREMLVAASPDRDGRDVKLTTILDRSVETLDALRDSKPETAVVLHDVVGRTYLGLGALDKARPILEAAVALAEEHLGEDHRLTLTCRDNLGLMLSQTGKHAEAERLQRDVLSRRLAKLGEDSADVAESRINLASTLVAAHRDKDALPLLRLAHRHYESTLSSRHRKTIQALNGIGMSLQRVGDVIEAENSLRAAVQSAVQELGDEHPTTLAARSNLAGVLIAREKPEAAHAVWTDLLAAQEEIYGKEDHRVLVTVGNLVVALVNLERFADAEPLARRCTAFDRKSGRKINLLVHLNSLAVILYKQKKFAESKKTFAEMFASTKGTLPDEHWLVGQFHKCHGDCLLANEEFGAAETELKAGLLLLEKQFDGSHRRVRKVWSSLAELYEAWGKPEQAAEFRERLRD